MGEGCCTGVLCAAVIASQIVLTTRYSLLLTMDRASQLQCYLVTPPLLDPAPCVWACRSLYNAKVNGTLPTELGMLTALTTLYALHPHSTGSRLYVRRAFESSSKNLPSSTEPGLHATGASITTISTASCLRSSGCAPACDTCTSIYNPRLALPRSPDFNRLSRWAPHVSAQTHTHTLSCSGKSLCMGNSLASESPSIV